MHRACSASQDSRREDPADSRRPETRRGGSAERTEAEIIAWFVLVMKAVLTPAWAACTWTSPSVAKSPAWPCSCRDSCLAGGQSLWSGVPAFRCFSWFFQELPILQTVILVYLFFSCISEAMLVPKWDREPDGSCYMWDSGPSTDA